MQNVPYLEICVRGNTFYTDKKYYLMTVANSFTGHYQQSG